MSMATKEGKNAGKYRWLTAPGSPYDLRSHVYMYSPNLYPPGSPEIVNLGKINKKNIAGDSIVMTRQ